MYVNKVCHNILSRAVQNTISIELSLVEVHPKLGLDFDRLKKRAFCYDLQGRSVQDSTLT